ncbi:MAG: hypothetical protein EOO48_09530 [Flavobacterium sp.]|nr:MAG: hypothetical protein EOO48_09530 [Flavobacterium sp.]
MKDSLPSLVLFVIAGTLALVAKICDIEVLMIVAKPMVIPSIFYYYLQTKTSKIDFWFCVALWCFFISDMVMVLFPQTGMVWIMVSCMISYIIMLKFAIDDCKVIKFSAFNIVFLAILLLLLSYILFTILNLNIDSIIGNYLLYLVYGIILILLVAVSAMNYLSDSSTAFLHLCSMALCMLVSDLFFCIFRFIIQLPVIDHINLFAQFMSYFFMVRYFNSRRNKELEKLPN